MAIFKSAKNTPRHKTNTCRKFSSEINICMNACGAVFALARMQENIFEKLLSDYLPNFGGIHCSVNTCPACICTRATTGKIPGELFMYWFRARRYYFFRGRKLHDNPSYPRRERSPKFRLRKLKPRARNNPTPYLQPFHTPTRLPLTC